MTRVQSTGFDFTRGVAAAALAAAFLGGPSAAAASERRFTYSYESGVLRAGGREIEPWNTFRVGRREHYSRLDTRLEAEMGVADLLQTSLYLNLTSLSADTADGRESTTEIEGLSSEWKLKLADPVADRFGLALYGELSGGPSSFELEGRLIADKRVGRWLSAFNVSWEHEWEFEAEGETEQESVLEATAGSAWFLKPSLTLGVELRSHTVFLSGDEPTRSAVFAGPVLSYGRGGWWITASVMPQLVALAGRSDGHLDLTEHERVEARILFGLEF
jgi:hypothetical protein